MKFIKNICLILVVVFLVSCGSSGRGDGEGTTQNFKQGSSEVNVGFLKNAPPDKIYQDSAFAIIAELDNQAAYDVINGHLEIVNLDPKYFQMNVIEHDFEILQGRSLVNPAGEKEFFEFDGTAQQLFQNAEQYVAPYSLEMSYSSTMEFADTFCINQNVYDVYDSGCQVQNSHSFGGQGAPLAVTQIEEIITPGSSAGVEFRVKVQNRGRGKIKQVTLTSSKLGNDVIDCFFQRAGVEKNVITLQEREQEATLLCRKGFLGGQSSYTTTFSLVFAYDYERSDQFRLTLVK